MSQFHKQRLKYLTSLKYGDAIKAEEHGSGSVPVYGSNGQFSETSKPNTQAPVIVIGRKGSFGKINWSDESVYATDTTFFVDSTATKVDLRWLYYYLLSIGLDTESDDAAVPGLSRELAYSKYIIVPPSLKQRRIASYLDRETSEIDRLIAAKERLLTLLSEKRRALITHAITKTHQLKFDKYQKIRFDGNVDFPVVPLKYLTKISGGATPNRAEREYWEGDIPWVSPKDMKSTRIFDSQEHITERGLSASGLNLLPVHSLMIVVRGMILAHSMPVALNEVPVTINQDMRALTFDQRVLPTFALLYFQGFSSWLLTQVTESAHGTKKLDTEVIQSLPFMLFPLKDQEAVVDFVATSSNTINLMEERTMQTIQLLNERRSALIASAVTGELEV